MSNNPKKPVSVLRKVGSSKCLQQDFQPNVNYRYGSNGMDKTVTLLNVEDLPSFSTERYYMLSEIEMKVHSVHFLSDLYGHDNNNEVEDDDITQDLSTSSHSLPNDQDMNYSTLQSSVGASDSGVSAGSLNDDDTNPSCNLHLPPCLILYLLWRPDCIYETPSAYAENVIQPSIKQIMELYDCPLGEGIKDDDSYISNNKNLTDPYDMKQDREEMSRKHSLPSIYIIVDRIVLSNHMDQIKEGRETDDELTDNEDFTIHDQNIQHEKKQLQIDIAETLIRKVSTDSSLKLRQVIHGISVGLSDNIRAAPGLELCMDAILVGDAERRRFSNRWKKNVKKKSNTSDKTVDQTEILWKMDQPNRSSIGIFTEYSDDLTGLDPMQETDAAQKDLLLHARCNGGWEGKGNIMNFAFLSQKVWKQYWDRSAKEINDDDYLLHMYSIIMGRYGGSKSKRRTGRKSTKNDDRSKDDTSFQCRFLPCENEQQSVERTANVMVVVLLFSIGYSLWKRRGKEIMEYIQIFLERLE